MTTVKEFKDLGGKFIINDKCIVMNVYNDDAFNLTSEYDDEIIVSFAWRTSTPPTNPKFKYEKSRVDFKLCWRPLLDQPKKSTYDVDAHVSGEKVKPVFTQAMAYMQHELWLHKANSELLATLTEFMVKNNIGNAGESCIDVAIRELSEKHGIDSRTPKQKAVDDMMFNGCQTLTVKQANELHEAGFGRKC